MGGFRRQAVRADGVKSTERIRITVPVLTVTGRCGVQVQAFRSIRRLVSFIKGKTKTFGSYGGYPQLAPPLPVNVLQVDAY